MADKLGKIVYLSQAQRDELFDTGTITVGNQTVTYDDNDIYIVPQHWFADGEAVSNYYIKDATGAVRLNITNTGSVVASEFVGSGSSLTDVTAVNTEYFDGRSIDEFILEGDSRLSNARPASDVYSWAKASSKPSYTASEVGARSSTWVPSLNDVSDVTISSATTNQVLQYTGSKWENKTLTIPAGTVTSVTGTSPIVSSGGATPAISLANNYGDTKNPYASKTAKYFLAAPNSAAGVPTFRAIVASDIPTLNQNTTGSAATLTNARTIAISGGATGTATSFNGGANISIPVTAVSEAYLVWGGKNFSGGYGPVDAAMVGELGANRLAFINPSSITIEYSTNGGVSWTDYSSSDGSKVNLFNGVGANYSIGKNTTVGVDVTNFQLRVTINTSSAPVYTAFNKFVVLCSTKGSSGSWITIDGRTNTNYNSDTNTWVTFANQVGISGWSGYNVINTPSFTTYGNTDSQYRQVRFTFGNTGYNPSYSGLTISKILGFGGVGWSTASNMAKTGKLYSYDYLQNVTFPGNVNIASGKKFQINGTNLSAADVGARPSNWNPSASDITSGVLGSTYGGTGVNNAGRTLTINTNSGTLAFSSSGKTLTVANTASVSGTNTGDQTITLTGDVTGSGTGSFATSIANDVVTNAKLANVANYTIKGRLAVSGSGNVMDLDATQVKTILNYSLGDMDNVSLTSPATGNLLRYNGTNWVNATVDTTLGVSTTGFVKRTGANTYAIAQIPAVNDATLTLSAGTGVSLSSTPTFTANAITDKTITITNSAPNATHTGDVTGSSALTITDGAVVTAKIKDLNVTTGKIAANAVTNAKLATVATNTLKGRKTAGTGQVEDIAIADVKTMLGLGSAAYLSTGTTSGTVATGNHTHGIITSDGKISPSITGGAGALTTTSSDSTIGITRITHGGMGGSEFATTDFMQLARVGGIRYYVEDKLKEHALETSSLYYVEGNSGGTAGTWTGTIADLSSLYTGLTISYKINTAGASTTTLNINSLGAKQVNRNTGKLTTHLPVGTVVVLTYDGTYWVWADYDATESYVVRYNQSLLNKAPASSYALLAQNVDTGQYHAIYKTNTVGDVNSSVEFNINGPLLYNSTSSAITSDTARTTTVYAGIAMTATNIIKGFTGGVIHQPVFLVGSIGPKGGFTPHHSGSRLSYEVGMPNKNTIDNRGKLYWYIGYMYSTTAIRLELSHPCYYLDESGEFNPYVTFKAQYAANAENALVANMAINAGYASSASSATTAASIVAPGDPYTRIDAIIDNISINSGDTINMTAPEMYISGDMYLNSSEVLTKNSSLEGGMLVEVDKIYTNETVNITLGAGTARFMCLGYGTVQFGSSTSTLPMSINEPRFIHLKGGGGTSTTVTVYAHRWNASNYSSTVTGWYPGQTAVYMKVPSTMRVYKFKW